MTTLHSPQRTRTSAPLVLGFSQFLRVYWLRSLLISAALLIPCFWHRHLEAGDLATHVYNAWLATLIQAGQAPGLWLATRWNNVFFDFMLAALGHLFGWSVGEKIASGLTVLVFFWGAFALITALTRRQPWNLLPCLAIFAYGWIFESGLMNCYLSFGIAFFALAILVRGRGWQLCLAAPLIPLIWLAHPFGLALLFALGAYVLLVDGPWRRHRLILFLMSACALAAIHLFVIVRYKSGVGWPPRYIHDGFDQLLLFGPRYLVPARMLRVFICICLLVDIILRRRSPRRLAPFRLSAELYVLVLFAALLLPEAVDTRLMRQVGFISIGLLNERLTAVAAILICCLAGAAKPRKWHLAGFSLIAIVFFALLYRDTAIINRTEEGLVRLVRTLPAGQRVIATIETFPESRVATEQVIDRACIGRCFDYFDYEPQVRQFRVRANAGNPFVFSDMPAPLKEVDRFQNFEVQPHNLPLDDISRCDVSGDSFCVRALAAGDTAHAGYRLDYAWALRDNPISLILDLLLACAVVACSIAISRMFAMRRPQARLIGD